MAISATASKRETQFQWEGKDKRGHKVRGKSLAANEAALRADLRRQGVAATRVKTQSSFKGGGKVQPQDIAVFARQLATMMSAGIPMVQAFEIIGNGHEKPSMQKLVLDVKSTIEGGSTLHESLAKHPLYFDDLFVNLVEAGEHAGALETLLDKIATYKEKNGSAQKEDQESVVLSRCRINCSCHSVMYIVNFRHSPIRITLQGLWRRPAGVHADGRQPVAVHAASRLDTSGSDWRRCLGVLAFL